MSWRMVLIFFIAFGIAISIVGCGDDEDEYDPDPMSVPQLKNLFETEARKFGLDFNLRSFDVNMVRAFDKRGVVGRCWFRGRGYMRGFLMELLTSFWIGAKAEKRELLFFHEGGHCFMGQDHRRNSIMAPSLFSGYFDSRSSYLSEFFLYGYDMRSLASGEDDRIQYIDIMKDGSCEHSKEK